MSVDQADREDHHAPRALYVLSGGGLTHAAVKQILRLSGYEVRVGVPGEQDLIGVWGNNPISINGEIVLSSRKTGMVRVEDAWLRSLFPGRNTCAPVGLLIDENGAHYDASTPSDLEMLLSTHPMDDTALLDRARGAIERLKEAHLTKYSAVDPDADVPPPGYVLVIDQTEGDASVDACGADRNRFLEMLFVAQEEHPGSRILIKSHPETAQGFRAGYYSEADTNDRISLFTAPISPWTLLDGAIAVYTVSSQLGFEAIFAGHKPRIFGTPFYAGWGLTEDEFPVQRRQRRLSRAQLFAAAVVLYPKWYDPFTENLCSFETALENLASETRAWREDRNGWIASEIPKTKTTELQRFFGVFAPVQLENAPARARQSGKPWMVWSGAATLGHRDATSVSKGILEAAVLSDGDDAALSFALDDLGAHEDPRKPSRLETLIAARADMRPDQHHRAEMLIRKITALETATDEILRAEYLLPDKKLVLVIGTHTARGEEGLQYAQMATDAELLTLARAQNPDAHIAYMPDLGTEHDARSEARLGAMADLVVKDPQRGALFDAASEVWTIASPLGFYALIRGLPVTTLGAPFYAGWRLTNDLGDIPPRRRAEPDITGLVHACLIDYPRYVHPHLQRACPVEAILDWLSQTDSLPQHNWHNRLMAKVSDLFSSPLS